MALSFDQLIAMSVDHAAKAEEQLGLAERNPAMSDELLAHAVVHSGLAEAYARLASAVVVNVTSARHVIEQGGGRGN